MRWLPWLTKTQRASVLQRLNDTVSNEVCKRHWGAPAPGVSPGGTPRFYIMDIRGLFMAAGILRYTLAQFQTSVYYRGQRKDWAAQVSLLRGAATRGEARVRVQWLTEALALTKPVFDPPSPSEEREALLQHYGLHTRWLDVMDNVQMAAWFAYHGAQVEPDAVGQQDDGSGHITAIACPTKGGGYATAFDLRGKPSEWLRPHVQQAWAIRSTRPDIGLGNLHFLQASTFIVPRPLLRQWSAYETLTPEVVFPRENEDRGVYYWRRAQEQLARAGLYPPPWKKS